MTETATDTPGPRWLARLRQAEDLLLGALMLGLVALSASTILRRLLFNDGWFGAEALGRSLVLWIALLGALAATREGRHVRIDLLHGLAEPWRGRVDRINAMVAAAFCAVFAWFGGQLVMLEWEVGDQLLPGVPLWFAVTIIPAGFLLMALRFLLQALFGPPRPGDLPA